MTIGTPSALASLMATRVSVSSVQSSRTQSHPVITSASESNIEVVARGCGVQTVVRSAVSWATITKECCNGPAR